MAESIQVDVDPYFKGPPKCTEDVSCIMFQAKF